MGACCSSQGAQQKATAKRTAGAATGGPAGAGAAAAAPAAAAGGPPSRPDDLSPPSEVRDIESSATASRGGTRKPPQEGRSARPLESAPLPASALPVSRLPVPSPDMNLSEENGASKRGGDDAEEDPSIFLEFSPRNASNRIDVFTHPEKPAPLSDQDKERMVNQLINITHLDRGEALSALESCNFDIDEAVGFALAAGASPAMAGASRSELAKRQNQILPSHLKRSQTVSEILLESSIVGQYVMLPWNEADADIRHNFYYEQAASDERRRGARLPNSELFTDPEGQITLSTRQQQRFHEWRRVRNAINEPVIVLDRPSSQCIRQGFVGDCSFLSSLSVLAEFENKSSIPVLTGLLYPQVSHSDANRILPVINPKGMYACRLYFNGVPRRVVIDDHVPVRRDGKLLAAHSSNKREVWVTLLEKAFVKMMGGSYFMQGSNPGSDLYHLTGWIPETIPFKADVHIEGEDPQPHPHPHQHQHQHADQSIAATNGHGGVGTNGGGYNFSSGERIDGRSPKWLRVWGELSSGLAEMRCVACLGTSDVEDAAPSGLDYPEGVSISSGIVARHAYSVLGCREVGGHRLLYVKNPWGCIRWKGKFAPGDNISWTPQMRRALDYDPETQASYDNGCFWIEWNDIVQWFSHLYICWNATCFPYQSEAHSRWDRSSHLAQSCLADDSHLVAFNPQFHLRIHPPSIDPNRRRPPPDSRPSDAPHSTNTGGGQDNSSSSSREDFFSEEVEVWILLSRHVRERKKALSQKYLAVHVHTGSERVTCPPPPAKQGVYSNGECSLVKLRCLGNSEHSLKTLDYVLVVSQYSQKEDFNFTLKSYSHVHTTLQELPPMIPDSWRSQYITGEWVKETAGGCSNDLWKYFMNPHYRIHMPEAAEVVIFLECPVEHSVNVRIFRSAFASPRLLRTGKALSSGPYRAGCCTVKEKLEKGLHTIVLSTFRHGETGAYQLCVHSPYFPGRLFPLPVVTPLPWPHVCPPPPPIEYVTFVYPDTGGGAGGAATFRQRYAIRTTQTTLVSLRLQVVELSPPDAMPSMVLSKQRGGPSGPGSLVTIKKSDLEGGLSDDGRTTSSAATNLYQEQRVVTLTLAELEPTRDDSTVVLDVGSTLGEAAVGSFVLYIYTDVPVNASPVK